MASKRKAPSFDIPAAVRHAGQAGWVYRTEASGGKGRQRPAARRAAARKPARDAVTIAEPVVAAPAPVPVSEGGPAGAPANVAGRLVGFGLHVAALPFMVPLYLTAAVSRRLGTSTEQ